MTIYDMGALLSGMVLLIGLVLAIVSSIHAQTVDTRVDCANLHASIVTPL